jgi:hypothetical protein
VKKVPDFGILIAKKYYHRINKNLRTKKSNKIPNIKKKPAKSKE